MTITSYSGRTVCGVPVAIALLLLAASRSGGDDTPISTTSNTVNGWTAFYSPGVTLAAAPGALFAIAIPGNSPTVCPSAAGTCTRLGYVQKAAPPLKTGQTITMTGSVQATP